MSIQEIEAFILLSDNLALGGQPTEAHLKEINEAGFKTVINLGLLDQPYSLTDEAGAVQSLGMEYHHIPVDFKSPGIRELHHFFETMDECTDRKTFVHCAANYRVTCFVSLYLRSRNGWSSEQARHLIFKVWEPDETWQKFMEQASSILCLDQPEIMVNSGFGADGVPHA